MAEPAPLTGTLDATTDPAETLLPATLQTEPSWLIAWLIDPTWELVACGLTLMKHWRQPTKPLKLDWEQIPRHPAPWFPDVHCW